MMARALAVLYVAVVVALTVRVLGYGDGDWLIPLIVITLPWSVLVVVLLWSLIHGASLWLFWLVFLGGGAANAFLGWRIYRRMERGRHG